MSNERSRRNSSPATARRLMWPALVAVVAMLVSLRISVPRGRAALAPPPGLSIDDVDVNGATARAVVESPTVTVVEPARDKERALARPCALRVVDDVTAEPVPDVEVELIAGGARARVLTDAAGEAEAPGSFRGSTACRIMVRDLGDLVATRELDRAFVDGLESIAVPIGPTIRLTTIDGRSIDPAQWKVRVRQSARAPGVAGVIRARPSAESRDPSNNIVLWAPSADFPDKDWSWIALRSGIDVWARYARREHAHLEGALTTLEIETTAGDRRGAVSLASAMGIQAAPGALTERFAQLTGRLEFVDAEGHGATPKSAVHAVLATVDLEPGAAESKRAVTWSETSVNRDGTFAFSRLERRAHRLLVWGDEIGFVETGPLDLTSGDRHHDGTPIVVSDLRDVPRAAHIVSASRSNAVKYLRAQGSGLRRLAGAWGACAVEAEDRVLLPPMPRGSYVVDLVAVPDLGRHFVARVPDCPLPAAVIRAEVMDQPRRIVTVDRIDDDPAERYRQIWSFFGPVGSVWHEMAPFLWSPGSDGQIDVFRAIPSDLLVVGDSPFHAMFWRDHRQPKFLTRADFAERDGELHADVVLSSGFGALIAVRCDGAVRRSPDHRIGQNLARWDWDAQKIVEPKGQLSTEWNRGRLDGGTLERRTTLLAPPVSGVRLISGDETVAVSDDEGIARIALDTVPHALTVVADGWRAVELECLAEVPPCYVLWLEHEP